ncbi:YfhO family protein [Niallia endozanthoxylica]|uniref:YfhO family protein n=1 Tax=Niallia endozanthoxylica TaxID=2036016 RepID=A0A5J5HNS1_9BACI|nr:YfhO family protein [Niallia endozanthoxylica]KAA9022029.1 YfhO family protein [Niallia endozanthoxylica]
MKKLLDSLGLFTIPILIIIAVFLRLDITPFGGNSIWYIDLPQQMTMFYNHLYDVLKGNASPIYTWNYGMGTSFWATIAYYLSSPLSILILLFPRSFIPFSILVIWLIKIGLSSVTMAYLLRKHFTPQRWIIFIFSISYALMSYSITYYFLPMWIDAVYLLPIIIAGVHEILKSERSHIFLIGLTLMFFANFYISYMVGLFVFLYFVGELYLHSLGKKERLKRFFLFFKSVILAFLFTCFITIPTFLELRKNKYTAADVNELSYLLNPLDLYGSFFNGTTIIQNLSIYAGVGVILLVPLYFLNKTFPVKERVVYGFLLGFLLYSMTFTFLNMAWHVFELPNGAHYRYAFIVSFLMIILSVKAAGELEWITMRQIIGVAGVNLVFLSLANKLLDGNIYTLWLINKNLFILVALTILIVVLMNKKGSILLHTFAKMGLCLLILVDLGMNSQTILRNYISPSHPVNWYDVHNPSYEKAFNRLQEMDDSFYRTKVDPSLVTTLNESLRYKYKGMGIYTSTGNGEHNLFLRELGYAANSRAANMGNGIFLSDALFGFKYVVTTSELDERIYTKMFQEGNIMVYRIHMNLPLGYMVDQGFMNKGGEKGMFNIQNHLMDGEEASYYEKQNPEAILHSLEEVVNEAGKKVVQRESGNGTPSIETNMTISDTRELYMNLDAETIQNFEEKINILINGAEVRPQNMGLGGFISLGTYEDESLNIRVQLEKDTQTMQIPSFYTLNYSELEKAINGLQNKALEIKEYSDTQVTGEIIVQDKGTLFLSIPYDENWKVTVDGENAEYEKVGSFIGVPLSEGTHTVHLEYVPKILYMTMAISGLSLLLYLVFLGRRILFARKSHVPTVRE